MVRWCIRLTRLTLVCEVIRYRLVQVRQNQKKDFSGWRPAIAFLYLFLFHSLLCLTSFLSQYKRVDFVSSSTSFASKHRFRKSVIKVSRSPDWGSWQGRTQHSSKVANEPPSNNQPALFFLFLLSPTTFPYK